MRDRVAAIEVIATNCIFCGKPLNDPESTQRGSGPDCNKTYGQQEVNPAPTDVARAMGSLARNQTYLKQVDPHIMVRVVKEHPNGHRIGTELIYTASSYRKDKQFVSIISESLRHLGYTAAAEKIKENVEKSLKKKVAVTLKFVGDLIEVHMPYHKEISQNMYKIPGQQVIREPGNARYRHRSVPKDQIKNLLTLLGMYLPGKNAYIEEQGIVWLNTPPQDEIDALNNAAVATSTNNGTTETVRLVLDNNRIEVYAPYCPPFAVELKKIPDRVAIWDKTGKKDTFICWTVPVGCKSEVVQLANKFFPGAQIKDELKKDGLDWL